MSTKKEKYMCNQCSRCAVENTAVLGCADDDCPCHQSESIEWEKEFVESGASIEHDRWARWQKYMFSKGTVDENGVFHLPKEFVERWFRQIDTKYADLSEPEKESDRKESRTYIPLVKQAITTAVAKAGKKAYAEGFQAGCKALGKNVKIIK